MTKEIFEVYVETQLAPTLEEGDIVTLDNLPSHKSDKAKAILKDRGAWFLFLPPYSPDLNPIGMAFWKLKAHLRSIGAKDHRRPLEGGRQHLRPLPARRMSKLLHCGRIWVD